MWEVGKQGKRCGARVHCFVVFGASGKQRNRLRSIGLCLTIGLRLTIGLLHTIGLWNLRARYPLHHAYRISSLLLCLVLCARQLVLLRYVQYLCAPLRLNQYFRLGTSHCNAERGPEFQRHRGRNVVPLIRQSHLQPTNLWLILSLCAISGLVIYMYCTTFGKTIALHCFIKSLLLPTVESMSEVVQR